VIWVDRSLMRGRGALIEDCYIPSAVGSSWACAYINKFLHKVLSDDFMLCRDLRLPLMLTERALLLQCFTPRYHFISNNTLIGWTQLSRTLHADIVNAQSALLHLIEKMQHKSD